jgi:hypothetical protein
MNVTSLTSWKSHDVVPNASFTRHDVAHCSVDVTVITELCISAAYRISSSGSSLPRIKLKIQLQMPYGHLNRYEVIFHLVLDTCFMKFLYKFRNICQFPWELLVKCGLTIVTHHNVCHAWPSGIARPIIPSFQVDKSFKIIPTFIVGLSLSTGHMEY